jgi:hypothetical protein
MAMAATGSKDDEADHWRYETPLRAASPRSRAAIVCSALR